MRALTIALCLIATPALADGAQVCDRPEHPCLIAYGNGRRMAAVNALAGMGIAQPAWWKLWEPAGQIRY